MLKRVQHDGEREALTHIPCGLDNTEQIKNKEQTEA
jgi:hypothetical protein